MPPIGPADNDQLSQAPPIPPDAEVFAFSLRGSWFFAIAMLMALAEASLLFMRAWSTADPTTRVMQIPEGIFFALVAELNWRFLRRSRTRIAVNSQGIWRRQGSRCVFLAWSDVATVRADDVQQRLELTDRREMTTIQVDYHVADFERLRAFILSQSTEQAQLERPGMTVFHHSSGNKLVYTAVAALLFFFAWQAQHHAGHPLIPALLGVVMLFLVLREPTSVVIGHDGIAIHYVGYQRDISFSSIADVALSDVRFRGNVWAGVLITTNKGARIRLSRFREGSVALFEALQVARKSVASAQGMAFSAAPAQPSASHAPPSASIQPMAAAAQSSQAAAMSSLPVRRTGGAAGRSLGLAFGAIVFAALAMIGGLGRTKAGRALSEAIASRGQTAPTYPLHPGPVAQLSQLRRRGTVYLVQMGGHTQPYSLTDLAQWLRGKYAIDVQVLPAMAIDPSAWDAKRHQYVAEQLYAQIKQQRPDLAVNPNAYLIGFTDGNMYSVTSMWSSVFTQRDHLRAAMISADGMGDTAWQRTHLPGAAASDRLRGRMRRILLKDVAMLYWHLPLNNDASSLLDDPLDPDLPTEDLYESDLDPALSVKGLRLYDPCLYFTYSDAGGLTPLPGPVVRDCADMQDPVEDESVEVIEVYLRYGLLIDKHTDIYLPGVIPIEFQRATRDGGYGKQPFGISGGDNYDEVLGSADNIHVFDETSDGTEVKMIRVPEWLPVLPLVKYVGGREAQTWVPGSRGGSYQTVWQYQLAWHQLPYEQYDLQRLNGEMKTFLPCGAVRGLDCLLVDYHDSQGHELKIDRDSLRRLSRITSPNGSFVGVSTDDGRRILAVDDSRNRTVLYGYDAVHNLTSVTYPSGEMYHYAYDGFQHILSVAVSASANSQPRVVLRNEYQDKMLSRMTLPDGSVYDIHYDSDDRMAVHHATIRTPDGRTFNVEIGDPWTTVHEIPAVVKK
jgi:YD repeat-containing protein